MLETPTTESSETGRAIRTKETPEPRRELHPVTHAGGLSLAAQVQGARPQRSRATLRSAMGNQAVLRMMASPQPVLQTKLTINEPGDRYEQEADRVADQVMRMPDPAALTAGIPNSSGEDKIQHKCAHCGDEEEKLHRRESGPGPATAPPIVHEVLRSPGRQLDPATRAFFEPRFGSDFSGVRVHTDSHAAKSARDLNALAYTAGSHIVFANGQYAPHSASGQRLVAHELVHVGQQRGMSSGVAGAGKIGVQRQSAPLTQPQSTDDQGQKQAGDQGQKQDDPTAWLTLQGQVPLGQYQRVFVVPKPPPWLIGGQLAANLQFHSDDTGFELALLGQYGHIFTWNSKATAGGDQLQIGVQPSYVLISAKLWGDRSTQLALIAQGTYATTSSSDPTVAGQQISLMGGAQVTQDIANLGPVKLQAVASVAGGAVWNKGPADTGFSPAGAAQGIIGIQFALDVVKRKRTPPPDQHEKQREQEARNKQNEDEQRKADQQKREAEQEARKKIEEQSKKPAPPPPPPLPADLKIYFLKDKPLSGYPADPKVIDSETGGDDLNAAKTLVQATLAADPAVKVSISGYASVEAPTEKYNCDLGFRRSEWIRRQLGISPDREVDLNGKAPGSCEGDKGLISYGSKKATHTNVEAERRRDRYAIVHFQR